MKLAPFEKEHVPNTVEWVNDDEIISLIDRSPEPVTLEGCYEWYERISQDKTKAMFAIVSDEGTHIGNCGLFEINDRAKKAKLWIYIGDKSFWGKGLGKKALKELLAYGFGWVELNKIFLYIVEDNIRAKKLYESVGFVKEGVFRDDTFSDGKYKDAVYYGMLKEEYDSARGN